MLTGARGVYLDFGDPTCCCIPMYVFSLVGYVIAGFFGFPELRSRAMLSSFKGFPLDCGFSSPVPLLVVVSLAPFGLYGPLPTLLPAALFFIAFGLLNFVDIV